MKKVIIIGGGFGGLAAAKSLKKSNYEITLIDKTNHHLFQPLLYQVATAALSPGDIAVPIRTILRKNKNTRVILGEVVSIDKKNKTVTLRDGERLKFDYLIIAAGNRPSYYGNESWEETAPGLKTINDALKIREKILLSFEKAEKVSDKEDVQKYLNFVIIGGGPTGVEMAGAIAEISHRTMLRDFRKIKPENTKIILVEGSDKILAEYDSRLISSAMYALKKLRVEIYLNSFVTKITPDGVWFGNKFIETKNVIWTAGNRVSTILQTLETDLDNTGRAIVNKDLTIKGNPNIFVVGDAAYVTGTNRKSLPGVAPVAIQQGKYVAKILKKDINAEPRKPFRYLDKGSMATIGKAKAIAQIGKIKLTGLIAWLAWSFIHILFLINFRNKYKVMSEWIWYYITNKQGVRLITNSAAKDSNSR